MPKTMNVGARNICTWCSFWFQADSDSLSSTMGIVRLRMKFKGSFRRDQSFNLERIIDISKKYRHTIHYSNQMEELWNVAKSIFNQGSIDLRHQCGSTGDVDTSILFRSEELWKVSWVESKFSAWDKSGSGAKMPISWSESVSSDNIDNLKTWRLSLLVDCTDGAVQCTS